MNLAKRLGVQFSTALVAEVVSVVSGVILVVVLPPLLGPESYGLLFLAISILGLAREFSTFGIHKSTARYLSEYKETDPGQIRHILRTGFGIQLLFVALISATLLFGHRLIAGLVGETQLEPLLLLGSVFIIFSTFASVARIVTQGFERIEIASLLRSTEKMGKVVFVIGFVLAGGEMLGAFVGYIVSYALVALLGVFYIFYYIYCKYDSTQIERGLRKRIVEYSAPIAITQSAHTLDYYMDRILVGFFLGPAAVGYYTIGKQIVGVVGAPAQALGFTLSPTYSAKKAADDIEMVSQMYREVCAYAVLFYIPVATGMILLARPGIEFVLGPDYLGAVPVLQILSIYGVFQALTKLTGEGLDYLGRARHRAIVKGVTAVLNLGLNILLIPTVGVVGAAIASVVSFGIYTVFTIYIMYTELTFQMGWLLNQVGYALLVSGLMSACVLLLRQYIVGPVTLSVTVLVGGSLWLLSILYLDLIDVNRILTVVGSER